MVRMEDEEQVPEGEGDDEFESEETTRELVVPGEILCEDIKNFSPGRGTILNKDKKIVSLHVGLKQIKKNYVNVIPLRGIYMPQGGDKVIAVVVDKNPVKYLCDINAKELAELKPRNMMKKGGRPNKNFNNNNNRHGGYRDDRESEENLEKYDIGDLLIVKVLSADRLNSPELTTVGKYLGKKTGGALTTIDPPKIPRVIGRSGSMIKLLKSLTNTNIFVTQNGRIWLRGDDFAHERLLVDAINKIAREAHTIGLTDRIQQYIENEKKLRGIQ